MRRQLGSHPLRSEADLEAKCCAWAVQKRGVESRKFSSAIGDPDRLYLLGKGVVWFVEFKQPGRVPQVHQAVRIKKLTRLGYRVDVIDNFEDFAALLDELLKGLGYVVED